MNEKSIDQIIDSIFMPAADFISAIVLFPIFIVNGNNVPFILVWLAIAALFFTFYLRFVNIWGFRYAIDIIKGKHTHKSDPGEITHLT